MDIKTLYKAKLVAPDEAAALVGSNEKISIGMAMTEPPALDWPALTGPEVKLV